VLAQIAQGRVKEFKVGNEAERRRFQRLRVSLNVEFYVNSQETGQTLQGQGVLKDFSLSGIYFFAPPPIPLVPGQVLTLCISASLPHLDHLGTSHIRATGLVVRLETNSESPLQDGVAVNFLESPTFFHPSGIDSCR
jgi:hypothetical protein